MPGVNRLDYESGQYWPSEITKLTDRATLEFIEKHLWFITLSPRNNDFDVLSDTQLTMEKCKALADAANDCWQAIVGKKSESIWEKLSGRVLKHKLQCSRTMVNSSILEQLEEYKPMSLGWKLSAPVVAAIWFWFQTNQYRMLFKSGSEDNWASQ